MLVLRLPSMGDKNKSHMVAAMSRKRGDPRELLAQTRSLSTFCWNFVIKEKLQPELVIIYLGEGLRVFTDKNRQKKIQERHGYQITGNRKI